MLDTKTIYSHRDLIVWQRSMQLVLEIYVITEKFPKEEIYGLSSQMRRSAVSIPSNIAEGRCRSTRKDFAQFLRIAYGLGSELDTQIEIASQLLKTKNIEYTKAKQLLNEVLKMLNVMIVKMTKPVSKN